MTEITGICKAELTAERNTTAAERAEKDKLFTQLQNQVQVNADLVVTMNGLQEKVDSSIKHTEKLEGAVEQLSATIRRQQAKLAQYKLERETKRRSFNMSDDEVMYQ